MHTISKPVHIEQTESTTAYHLQVRFTHPTVEDIKQGVEAIRNHALFKAGRKFTVHFSNDVSLRRDQRNVITTNEIQVNFFSSRDGVFAYTFHRRTGYPVSDMPYGSMTRISYRIAKEAGKEREDLIEKILNRRYDEHTWSHLTPESLVEQATTIVSIKRKFPSHVIEALQEAFEKKTAYTYTKYGTKRDLRVQTKMGDDGVFRAWFSSEYAGCGNGQYYLLLNPTTASFCEWD